MMNSRAYHLLHRHFLQESSGLDVTQGGDIAALAPQYSSPPENDLQNNRGYVYPSGKKYIEGGWVNQYNPQRTQLRNATLSPMMYLGQNTNPVSTSTVYDEELLKSTTPSTIKDSDPLPHSDPKFHVPNPGSRVLQQSAAKKYANRLSAIRRDRHFRKSISASWSSPKATSLNLPPSMKQ